MGFHSTLAFMSCILQSWMNSTIPLSFVYPKPSSYLRKHFYILVAQVPISLFLIMAVSELWTVLPLVDVVLPLLESAFTCTSQERQYRPHCQSAARSGTTAWPILAKLWTERGGGTVQFLLNLLETHMS
jgi:hypothetical protein